MKKKNNKKNWESEVSGKNISEAEKTFEVDEKVNDEQKFIQGLKNNATDSSEDEPDSTDVSFEKTPEIASENGQNGCKPDKDIRKPGFLSRFVTGLINRQIFQKGFSLLFALFVFGGAYYYMVAHRSMLSYLGVMLLMVVVYAEILIIRDHLWVLEGSMREARKWRDIFFNQTSLRRQRFRKIVLMIFASAIFSYIYMRVSSKNAPAVSFMGIILMITILYYEILTVRDDVFIMMQAVVASEEEKNKLTTPEKGHEKFLDEIQKESALDASDEN